MTMNPDEMARWAKAIEADQEGQKAETPGVLPPRVRINWKLSAKGERQFDMTWEGTGEYSPEELDTAREQALAESTKLLHDLSEIANDGYAARGLRITELESEVDRLTQELA